MTLGRSLNMLILYNLTIVYKFPPCVNVILEHLTVLYVFTNIMHHPTHKFALGHRLGREILRRHSLDRETMPAGCSE